MRTETNTQSIFQWNGAYVGKSYGREDAEENNETKNGTIWSVKSCMHVRQFEKIF